MSHDVEGSSAGRRVFASFLGVVNMVAETDFSDIRRCCGVHSSAGQAIIIPRGMVSMDE
ncbi:unnamed protein product [Penicillium camemberti]|uniref:Str. FM013 n=1 Tax=Penicillium camemberti (strain FM 013) TaxID=1429867 RepID=A0A0G4PUG1_PENC3|nr:unnamed protein product [Penicillium camemberti]